MFSLFQTVSLNWAFWAVVLSFYLSQQNPLSQVLFPRVYFIFLWAFFYSSVNGSLKIEAIFGGGNAGEDWSSRCVLLEPPGKALNVVTVRTQGYKHCTSDCECLPPTSRRIGDRIAWNWDFPLPNVSHIQSPQSLTSESKPQFVSHYRRPSVSSPLWRLSYHSLVRPEGTAVSY